MGVFTDIDLVWNGRVYTIKSNRVMGAIAQIEDLVTLAEIAAFGARGTMPMARLCQGYAAAFKYAGAKVTGEDILQAVYAQPEKQLVVMKAVAGLLAMGMPPDKRVEFERAMAIAEAGADTEDSGGDGQADGDALGNALATEAAS